MWELKCVVVGDSEGYNDKPIKRAMLFSYTAGEYPKEYMPSAFISSDVPVYSNLIIRQARKAIKKLIIKLCMSTHVCTPGEHKDGVALFAFVLQCLCSCNSN